MRYRTLFVTAMTAGALVLGGCGNSASAKDTGSRPGVVITGSDAMRFSPDTINVKAGEATTITFKNGGLIPHDFVTQGADKNVNLVNVGPGKQQSATFQANKPGTYTVVCNQPGHKEAGMTAKIVVG